MNAKDKRWAEAIIDYCNCIDDKENYFSDSFIQRGLCTGYY